MSETRKRSKKHYSGHAPKKLKRNHELEVGAEGVLITCNMNERKCMREAFNLLNEYADALYGPEQSGEAQDSHSEEDDDEDVEAALKKEVSQIQTSMKSRQQRFTALESGANNVVFIRCHGVDPEKLVHHILSDLHQTKKKKSRVILRMLPVSGTCRAFPEDMEKYLSVFLERWFKAPLRATYQICFKARNSSHNKRDDVIKDIAALVDQMNPENKVDLTNPELSIIMEIIKTVCCVSVVRDYTLFRKYNLQEVTKEPANQIPDKQEAVKSTANEAQEHGNGTSADGNAAGRDVSSGDGQEEAEPE